MFRGYLVEFFLCLRRGVGVSGCAAVLLVLPSSTSAQAPAISIQISSGALYLGDHLAVTVQLDGAGEAADAYVALVLPDQRFVTYGALNQPGAPGVIQALATGLTLSAASLPAIDMPLAAPLEQGEYLVIAALAPAGVDVLEDTLAIAAPVAFQFAVDRPVQVRPGLWRGVFEGLPDAGLEFTVGALGLEIESGARVTTLPFTCTEGCSGTLTEATLGSAVSLVELAFSASDPLFGEWAGSFDSPTTASGTYRLSADVGSTCGVCSVGELHWSATWNDDPGPR
jgi:hypothetical protein